MTINQFHTAKLFQNVEKLEKNMPLLHSMNRYKTTDIRNNNKDN